MSDCVQSSSLMSSSSARVLPPGNFADTIDNSFEKQSSSKLVNRYLSTAAQYLNRSKSFHILSSTTTTNNNNQSDRIIPSCHDRHFFLYHADLTQRSIPMNIDRINRLQNDNVDPPPLLQPPLPPSSIQLEEKSHGFVNTLRRSLRKNKERFTTKRTTNTLLHQNEINSITTMTPTTIRRRQTDLTSWIATTPKTRSNAKMNEQIDSNVCADEIHLSGK
jgi:hypothetical protein